MTSNWIGLLRSGGAATRICTLSSGPGWSHVAAPDKDGGTPPPPKQEVSVFTHTSLYTSLTPSLSFCLGRDPSPPQPSTLPPFLSLHLPLISSSSCQRSGSAEG